MRPTFPHSALLALLVCAVAHLARAAPVSPPLFSVLDRLQAGSTIAASVSTVAGNGTQATLDGPAQSSCLALPQGLSLDGATGDIYFMEFGGDRVKNISRCVQYNCTTPVDCACDMYYEEASGHRLRVLRAATQRIETVAGSGFRGYSDGPALSATFNRPFGVLALPSGDVLIADGFNHVIRRFNARSATVLTFAGSGVPGSADGPASQAQLTFPVAMTLFEKNNTLYIADRAAHCVRGMSLSTSQVFTVVGSCGVQGPLFSPWGLDVDQDTGNLFIADSGSDRIMMLEASSGVLLSIIDVTPGLSMPTAVVLDKTSNTLFIGAYETSTIFAFGLTTGSLQSIAGNGDFAFADGPGASASFKGPKAMIQDTFGNLIVADFFNDRLRNVTWSVQGLPPRSSAQVGDENLVHKRVAESRMRRKSDGPVRLLVWVGHSGVYHDHIAQGKLLASMLTATGLITTTFAESEDILTSLDQFDVVLFYADSYENPNQGILTPQQLNSLLSFVSNGGAFFGLHTACACYMSYPEYHVMLNAAFGGHSPYMDFVVTVEDSTHPITAGLSNFVVTDELYHPNITDPTKSKYLLTVHDPLTNTTHPSAFHHTYGQGSVFYFALGHDLAEFSGNPLYFEIIKRGVLWLASTEG